MRNVLYHRSLIGLHRAVLPKGMGWRVYNENRILIAQIEASDTTSEQWRAESAQGIPQDAYEKIAAVFSAFGMDVLPLHQDMLRGLTHDTNFLTNFSQDVEKAKPAIVHLNISFFEKNADKMTAKMVEIVTGKSAANNQEQPRRKPFWGRFLPR